MARDAGGSATRFDRFLPYFTGTIGGAAATQDLTWFGTFRGRIGYTVFDRWLPYYTGSLAYGGREMTVGAVNTTDTRLG